MKRLYLPLGFNVICLFTHSFVPSGSQGLSALAAQSDSEANTCEPWLRPKSGASLTPCDHHARPVLGSFHDSLYKHPKPQHWLPEAAVTNCHKQ